MTDLQQRVEELLAGHDPTTTPPAEFLGAQFDAGLAWVHFAPGKGGLGIARGRQLEGWARERMAPYTVPVVEVVESCPLTDTGKIRTSGLIRAGCDVVTVQRALGRSQPSITLDVYSSLWPDAEDRTRAAAAGMMNDGLGSRADSVRTGDRSAP